MTDHTLNGKLCVKPVTTEDALYVELHPHEIYMEYNTPRQYSKMLLVEVAIYMVRRIPLIFKCSFIENEYRTIPRLLSRLWHPP